MRLKKGDKAEIMNKKEVPVSWRSGEILSGNGHNFHVQYDSYPPMAGARKVETVPRKYVKPCQPIMQGVESYISGDIVEVFYEYAWKTASMLRALEGKDEPKSKKISVHIAAVRKKYLVRLIGCSEEVIVDESNIRTKGTWHDDRWVPCGKNSRGGQDVTASKPSTSTCYKKMNLQAPQFNKRAKKQPQKDSMDNPDETPFQESHNYTRSQKRMSNYGYSINEEHNGHTQKSSAIEKEGKKQRLAAAPVLEKVDAVAYPRKFLGEKNMHTSFKFISSGYNQMERAKLNDVLGCRVIRNSRLNSSDNDVCSVGSCSATDQSPNNLDIPSIPLHFHEADTGCSDAESCYGSVSERKSSPLPPEEEVEVSIRTLELHAYRRTLEALYVSGPLSWEQESMLTNLRIMLHISNDEHLLELKNLISAKTSISIR